jgi:hypothetical protein
MITSLIIMKQEVPHDGSHGLAHKYYVQPTI